MSADPFETIVASLYPYADDLGVLRELPDDGRSPAELLAEIADMARREDAAWEGGRCSGTMYSGDHDHYAFLNRVAARFNHVNALQRDMCPSMTRFESEIIAMTLDLMHGSAVAERGLG